MMIKLETHYQDITIRLEALFAGNDLCVLITGGDAHIGAISIYSKVEGIQTISLKHHKDHVIGERLLDYLKDTEIETISVSCGIHVDHITKQQIIEITKQCQFLFEQLKKQLQGRTS